MSEDMNRIMGIGPEIQFSDSIKKTLRIGTVKQLKDVGELFEDELKTIKYIVSICRKEPDQYAEQVTKWVEILNIICIEGFTKEEFEDSLPEQMTEAVSRFLFG